jgi:hypothetical protein
VKRKVPKVKGSDSTSLNVDTDVKVKAPKVKGSDSTSLNVHTDADIGMYSKTKSS